jgi:hypothetical protein
VICRPQPAMLPALLLPESSYTKRLHVPLPFVPSNIERLTFPLSGGAGSGKTSTRPWLKGR